MLFKISVGICFLVMIVTHGYIIFLFFQTIFKSTKMIRDNRNIKYFVKTWKVIFRHKAMCIYSVIFLLYVLTGIKIAKEYSILHPVNKDVALAMFPTVIHIFVLRYIYGMSIALNIRNIACGQRKHILVSMLRSLFYYYPSFIWKRLKACDILLDNTESFLIKAICYVLEQGKYKSSVEKAELLKKRFYLFGNQQVFQIPLFLYLFTTLLFSFDLFELWSYNSVLAISIKSSIAVLIGVSMLIDTLAIIYTCQIYFWNQKWEETYSEDLSLGKAAPNIKTIEFPEFNKKRH